VQRQVEPEEEERLQAKPLANQITPLVQVQRQEEPEEEEEETLQAKPLAGQIALLVQKQVEPEEEEEELQTKTTSGSIPEVQPNIESHIHSLKGGGQPLLENDRAFFEPRFGRDFSQVRVHSDSAAADTAKSINARAFTLGNHVVIGSGEYHPNSRSGQRLLGHELTHVVQQNDDKDERISRVPTRGGIQEQPPRYTYSTNCGWIDWSHAGTRIPATLIQQVRRASLLLRTPGARSRPSTGEFTSPTMRSGRYGIVLSSASMQIRLLRPLSANEIKSVALSIFKKISIVFEMQQRWTQIVGRSSFSQEDLPSNLIGFYMNARHYSRADINRYCGSLDIAGSLAEYNRNNNFRRNTSFLPYGIPASRWPAELSNINDSSASSLYEIRSISATQGSESFSFSPRYRVVGLINETDLLIISVGGTRFTTADNVQVVPTYRAYSGTHGLYGHVQMTQVRPYRQSDRNVFTRHNISWPIYVPDPVLQPLTSPGSGSSGTGP